MKKFISMAMALVMTLSLCTFVIAPKAEAADFEDVGNLAQYSKQAIDVIKAIQVMDGTSATEFAPEAGLTRQAAAKIICNMVLGPATAKALPTNDNPFPDVAAGSTFSGYISYCKQKGIISGYADGTFKGSNPLSGYAYLKMLLGALGYASGEEGFTGSNWKVNVAKIALGIHLNKGIPNEVEGEEGAQLDGQITREAAAIYAFNTLQADMVEYEGKNTLEINGVKVSMGGSNAVPQTWNTSNTNADNINAARSDGNNQRPIVQFAERYFDKLERIPNGYETWREWEQDGNGNWHWVDYEEYGNGRDDYTHDDFGRPAVEWKWKGVSVGTYARDPDATFVGNVKVNAIYEALHSLQVNPMTSADNNACLYINSSTPNNRHLSVSRGNDKDLDHANNLRINRNGSDNPNKNDYNANYGNSTGDDWDMYGLDDNGNVIPHRVDRIGDGALIEVFRNDANNHVDVCVISVYGGKVNAVKGATVKKDAYVTIDYASDADAKHRPDTITGKGNNEYETEDFEENDVVAYTYSDSAQSIKSMYLLASESGALTSRVNGKSVRLDDEPYSYGKEYTFSDMTENDLSSKSSYVVYLDDNDYVLWVEEDEFAVDQYVLIERITIEDANGKQISSVFGNATAPNSVAARVRTSSGASKVLSLDDSKNYRDNTGLAIAAAFQRGRIVRISSNSNGYRLHAVDNKYLTKLEGFALKDKKLLVGNLNTVARIDPDDPNSAFLLADSETNFTVEDTANDTYKPYVGIKNVPNIQINADGGYVNGATAYVYRRGNLAKQIFVVSATNVSSSSNDIIFFAANSTSNMVESDDGNYYDVTAVEKGEVKTVRISNGAQFVSPNGDLFKPGVGGTQKAYRCVVLNDVTYDSNDLVTEGRFKGTDPIAVQVQGIRRVNAEEVRLDTGTNNSYLRDVAENVRVFFVDGDEIEPIDYDEITNDTWDWVYYVEDDGVITYLFIVDFEPEVNNNNNNNNVATANINTAVQAGYTLTTTNNTVSAQAGNSFTFSVKDGQGNLLTQNEVKVKFSCTNTANKPLLWDAAEAQGLWTANVPGDLLDGSTITFQITPAQQ